MRSQKGCKLNEYKHLLVNVCWSLFPAKGFFPPTHSLPFSFGARRKAFRVRRKIDEQECENVFFTQKSTLSGCLQLNCWDYGGDFGVFRGLGSRMFGVEGLEMRPEERDGQR